MKKIFLSLVLMLSLLTAGTVFAATDNASYLSQLSSLMATLSKMQSLVAPTMKAQVASPVFTLNSPTAGQQLEVGKTYTVSWTNNDPTVTNYDVYLVWGPYTITKFIKSVSVGVGSGSFQMTVPDRDDYGRSTIGSSYKLRFNGVNAITRPDAPSAGFSIVTATTQTAINPTINSFTADSSTITAGSLTYLRYNVKDAASCSLIGGRFNSMNLYQLTPNTTFVAGDTGALNASTQYELQCKSSTGNIISKYLTVNVTQPTQTAINPTINSFTADSSTITAGSSTYLKYNVSNAVSCLINGGGYSMTNLSGVSAGTINTSTLSASTQYELQCKSSTGNIISKYLTVNVTQPTQTAINPTIHNFAVDNQTISAGNSTILRYEFSNAVSCSIIGGPTKIVNLSFTPNIGLAGDRDTGALNASTQYELQCKSSTGNIVSKYLTVNVTQPTTQQFTLNSPTAGQQLEVGKTYTVSWTNNDPTVTNYDVYLVWGPYTITKFVKSVSVGVGSGSFQMTVPDRDDYGRSTIGSSYKLRFNGVNAITRPDAPSAGFSIVSAQSTAQPVLSINSSIDGQTWTMNQNYVISWKSQSLSSSDKLAIFFKKPDGSTCNIASSIPGNSESLSILLQENTGYCKGIIPGKYRIEIYIASTAGYGLMDSTGDFNIVSAQPTAQPVLSVTSPTSGQIYNPGSPISVSFTGVKQGEQYEINLLKVPSKEGDVATKFGTIIGQSTDQSKNTFTVPYNISNGIYQVVVIQRTCQGGIPCSSDMNGFVASAYSGSFAVEALKPVITRVATKAGDQFELGAGGDVSIEGRWLIGNTKETTHVYIGGQRAVVKQVSDILTNMVPSSFILATVPNLSVGNYDLYVSNEKGQSNTVGVRILGTIPPFYLNSPAIGDKLEVGKTYTVRWINNDPTVTRYDVYLVWGPNTITKFVKSVSVGTGSGSFEMTVPDKDDYGRSTIGSGYKLRFNGVNPTTRPDAPSAGFSIVSAQTTSVVQASDSDNSPDYTNGAKYPITKQNYPDLFVKGVGKGIYAGSSSMTSHVTIGQDGTGVAKSTSGAYSTYYDYCEKDGSLNEAFVMSDGRLGATGMRAPSGYVCSNGAFVSSVSSSIYNLQIVGGVGYFGYSSNAEGAVKIGEPTTVSWSAKPNTAVDISLHNTITGKDYPIAFGRHDASFAYSNRSWIGWAPTSANEYIKELSNGNEFYIKVCVSGTSDCAKSGTFKFLSGPITEGGGITNPWNGEITYEVGKAYTLTWKGTLYSNLSSYNIHLGGGPEKISQKLGSADAMSGQFIFYMPKVASGDGYYFKIGNDYMYTSNKNKTFSITGGTQITQPTATPKITLLYPRGGEILDNSGIKENIATIKWTTENFGNFNIAIELIDSNGFSVKVIAQGIPNNGSYAWPVDPNLPNGTYRLAIDSNDKGPTASTMSDKFQIVNSQFGKQTSEPFIEVKYPLGGQGNEAGYSIYTVWNEGGFTPKDMKIYLSGSALSGQPVITLASLGASTQFSFQGTLPSNIPSGNDYIISVCDEGTPDPRASFKPLCGNSQPFTIKSTYQQPTVACKTEGLLWNPALSAPGTACCAGLTAETQPLPAGTSGRPYVKCVKSPTTETVTSEISTACTILTQDLRYKSTDASTRGEVTKLQDFLSTAGFFDVEPTGYFGAITARGVQKFQATYGINQTGGVGPLTRAKIKEVSCR
ncbi:TPA: hypothetical protein DDZ75_00275 [Patescibacteria group bacterium]|nr:hypothetical protein [Patescibacteria group bacterium]